MPQAKKPEPTPGNTRTLEEAHYAEKKLNAIGEPTYGIYLNKTGTNQYMSEQDMILNGITEGNLLIYMKPGVPNSSSESVPAHGEFQSVDMILDTIAQAYRTYSDPAVAADQSVSRLLDICHPGMSAGAVQSRKFAMDGVQDRYNKAMRLAFGVEPPPDPGPQ